MLWKRTTESNGVIHVKLVYSVIVAADYDSMADAYALFCMATAEGGENKEGNVSTHSSSYQTECEELFQCVQTTLVEQVSQYNRVRIFDMLGLSDDESSSEASGLLGVGERCTYEGIVYQYDGPECRAKVMNFSIRQYDYVDKGNEKINKNGLIKEYFPSFVASLQEFIQQSHSFIYVDVDLKTSGDLFSDKLVKEMFSLPVAFKFIDPSKLALISRLALYAVLGSPPADALMCFDDLFVPSISDVDKRLFESMRFIKEHSSLIPASLEVVPIGFQTERSRAWRWKSIRNYSKEAKFTGTSPLQGRAAFVQLARLVGLFAQLSYLDGKFDQDLFYRLMDYIAVNCIDSVSSEYEAKLGDANKILSLHSNELQQAMLSESSDQRYQFVTMALSLPIDYMRPVMPRIKREIATPREDPARADRAALAAGAALAAREREQQKVLEVKSRFEVAYANEIKTGGGYSFDSICNALYEKRLPGYSPLSLFHSDSEWDALNAIFDDRDMRADLVTSDEISYVNFNQALLDHCREKYAETAASTFLSS